MWTRVSFRGTHGGGPYAGVEPTGNTAEVASFEAHRIANGKIVDHWGPPDDLGLVRQLGFEITPPPGTEDA